MDTEQQQQQSTSVAQKLADSINTGYKAIGLILFCLILGISIFYGYRRFFHKSELMVDPTSTVTEDFSKVDTSDEQALLVYVGTWLNLKAPYVLNFCVPNKIRPEDCNPPSSQPKLR